MGLFDKLFNSKKRDTTYTGTQPIASLRDTQAGKEYYDKIARRSEGYDVGYGPGYASKYANPIIQRSRAEFQDYYLPELKSELVASGRYGGSGGFDQLRRAYNEQALTEGDIFSRLQQREEDARRQDIAAAIDAQGDVARADADLIGRKAAFDYGQYGNQLSREDQRLANQSAGYQRLVGGALDFAAPYAGGLVGRLAQRMPNYTGQLMSYGGGLYPVSTAPRNYDYSNISTARRMGQRGGAY